MPQFSWDFDPPTLPEVWVPPVPEVIDIPADLPTLEPSVVVTLPLSEEITSAVVVPGEHNGADVLYVAVSQERVNVWAAVVYFVPEIALGLSVLLVLVALRKLWVGRRFVHRNGEAYCKKCWAGLTGVESSTCPECGRPVAKTKRIAKRSRRSPLSPQWLWAYAAIILSVGTAGIWFGERWQYAWFYGFDYLESDDWLALVDPLEKDSVFRINKTAGWLDWRSARLAAFARERDQLWIETMTWEYDHGEGLHYHLLVRRFDTRDGSTLGGYALPEECPAQDSVSPASIELMHLGDIVLVDAANLVHYRINTGAASVWTEIGKRDPDLVYLDTAVSSDNRFIYITVAERIQSGLFSAAPATAKPRLVVFDADTGERVTELEFRSHSEYVEGAHPRFEAGGGTMPGTDVIGFHNGRFVPLDTPGQVLLYIVNSKEFSRWGGTYGVWDHVAHTFENAELLDVPATSIRQDLYSDNNDPSLNHGREINWLAGEDRIWQVSIGRAHRRGARIATDFELNLAHLRTSLFETKPPWTIYDPDTDILLFDLEPPHAMTQPMRVLRLQFPQVQTITRGWITDSGRHLVVGFSKPNGGDGILIETETNRALARLDSRAVNGVHRYRRSFVNDGTQLVAIHDADVVPKPANARGLQHEILVFDLPDTRNDE